MRLWTLNPLNWRNLGTQNEHATTIVTAPVVELEISRAKQMVQQLTALISNLEHLFFL